MKTLLEYSARRIGLLIAGAFALVVLATNGVAQAAQPPSPEGTWDCIVRGAGLSGILFLNFTTDLDTNSGLPTFEGVFVQGGHDQNQDAPGRGGSTGNSRSGSGSSVTNLFGGGFVNGTAGGVTDNGGISDWLANSLGYRGDWFYDDKGRVVGSFYTVVNSSAAVTNYFETCVNNGAGEYVSIHLTNGEPFSVYVNFCFTNAFIQTNYPWGPAPDGESGTTNLIFTNNNFTIGSIGITNNVSFVGKVIPGAKPRLTMVGTSTFGTFNVTGVPLTPVVVKNPNVSSLSEYPWTGSVVQNGVKSEEIFTLVPTGIPNVYGINGEGPSYYYSPSNSICLISSQKQIGFAVAEIAAGSSGAGPIQVILRGTVGPLINNNNTFGTKGVGDSSAAINQITFDANLVPYNIP